MIATVPAWLVDLERFLMPNICLGCGRLVERDRADDVVCGLCRSRIRGLTSGCQRCAQPMPPIGPCRFCLDWQSIAWVRSAAWLGVEARAAVHGLKYGGYDRLAPWMAQVIVRNVTRPERAVLIPVPLAAGRLRARGYNQAAALARALGAAWRLPVGEHVLERTRETVSQTALDPDARRRNVKGAFRATRTPGPAEIAVLIDDVLTTGATLLAAGTALAERGWSPAGAVTFARALDAGGRIIAGR